MGPDRPADQGMAALGGTLLRLIVLTACLVALVVLAGPSLEAKAQGQPTPTATATVTPMAAPAATATVTPMAVPAATATVTPTAAPAATGGTVAGVVFEDLNGDGLKGPDEPSLVNVLVTLRVRGGGAAARRETTTGPDGLYQFAGLAAGPYRLDIEPPPQFVGPDEDQLGINVAGAGETTRVDFALIRGVNATVTPTSTAVPATPTPTPVPATPTPTRPAASPVASPSPAAAVAKPAGAPAGTAPRAGGFPLTLALSLLGGGAATLGVGAYLLRRR